ncbi:hypothetical protein [Clavibacter capsici]|uniref:hypothetical protein n=1 Tax=Clavibacter capsici TaxID=1874630 RepID=UPI00293E610A|nr:hypothetical protein [Clavibacter capsici]
MTADETTAATAGRDDPGHGKRELVRIGARAIAAWIAEVITPRRRLLALGVAAVVGLATALLFRALFLGMDDAHGGETALAAALGLVIGALACSILLAAWLSGASRRLGSATGAHPHWRDAALLDRSVDARGRVALAPGTAERVAVESRRGIASGAVGVPAVLILGTAALVAVPVMLLAGSAPLQMLFVPLFFVMGATTVHSMCRLAGRMALLRDAADAELALPEAERMQAPRADPPHGSRLP